MRILFVAMPHSVHTARWINQLSGQGWDVHLFPVDSDVRFHTELRDVTVHDQIHSAPDGADSSVRTVDALWSVSERGSSMTRGRRYARRFVRRYHADWNDRDWRLAQVIKKLKPDIVHSLEMQGAGYLTLAARERLGGSFPTWIVTVWGNDIYLFGRLAAHRQRIHDVLSAADVVAADCQRDLDLAREHGFVGQTWPVFPTGGGFDLEMIERLRSQTLTSSRRLILLKGYQGLFGRSLTGLRAIALCADALSGYRVGVYLANDDVRVAAELLTQEIGVPIEIVPRQSHEQMLRLRGEARISIGLNISDGTPNSMLEAMLMGAFPIQSYTSAADEWVVHGESGLLVHPEDPQAVARAIRTAVADDALVDRAAEINWRTAVERLDQTSIRQHVIEEYRGVAARIGVRV